MREVTAADWFPLGVQLGIQPAKLREIEKDHHGNVWHCKFELLDWWHRNAKEVSWNALAHALEKMGGYGVLAQKLKRKMRRKLRWKLRQRMSAKGEKHHFVHSTTFSWI